MPAKFDPTPDVTPTRVTVDTSHAKDANDPHFIVTCNVWWANRITVALYGARQHAITCRECDVKPDDYSRMISEFDDVFMHVDDDGDHDVRISVYESTWNDDGVKRTITEQSQLLFGGAMMRVIDEHEAVYWFVCKDDGSGGYTYENGEVA